MGHPLRSFVVLGPRRENQRKRQGEGVRAFSEKPEVKDIRIRYGTGRCNRNGGERGIRTLGGSFPPHSLSRRGSKKSKQLKCHHKSAISGPLEDLNFQQPSRSCLFFDLIITIFSPNNCFIYSETDKMESVCDWCPVIVCGEIPVMYESSQTQQTFYDCKRYLFYCYSIVLFKFHIRVTL